MKVVILGAAGMIGRKLTDRIVQTKQIGNKQITSLTLLDVIQPEKPLSDINCITREVDISSPREAEKIIEDKPDIIFHLAAIVSGEAEADFDKGYRINFDGTRMLLEAIRHVNYKPRLVFTSSVAVFGAPFPEIVGEDFFCAPASSYGTQKAICELLISDYTRRGFINGVAIRLPAICVRPGKPNAAVTGFFSNIIREPLIGIDAVLPVSETIRRWFASPRTAVNYLLHAATLEENMIGSRRTILMPGVAATVADQIAALRKIAGESVVKKIKFLPDPAVEKMFAQWPKSFDASRALSLGFTPDKNFEEIIQAHIEDELDGRIAR